MVSWISRQEPASPDFLARSYQQNKDVELKIKKKKLLTKALVWEVCNEHSCVTFQTVHEENDSTFV